MKGIYNEIETKFEFFLGFGGVDYFFGGRKVPNRMNIPNFVNVCCGQFTDVDKHS